MNLGTGNIEQLGRRAVKCARWRWLPGMLTDHGRICGAGYLVSDDVDESGQPFVDCTDTTDDWSNLLPDLTDLATVGCLLVLVREAYRCPTLHAWYSRQLGCWVVSANGQEIGVQESSEARALVAALEAAP